jgi:putative transposase
MHYNSFSFQTTSTAVIEGTCVLVPKLGAVKVHMYRPIPEKAVIREVVFKWHKDKWTISFVVDLTDVPKVTPVTSVGIDFGLNAFATLSTGELVSNPRFGRNSEKLLARRQRIFARRQRGSASKQHAHLLVRKTYMQICNRRLDFTRKFAAMLFSTYDLVAFEDLNINNMSHGNLAKSIYDAAWGKTIKCLTAKAEMTGKLAIGVDPTNTTINCSSCTEPVPKTLTDREHNCSKCGLVLSRDHNAAINIHTRGLRVLAMGV